eukprot:scaffold478020_cov24-Prasinocladus_malaysianus.AAC.1
MAAIRGQDSAMGGNTLLSGLTATARDVLCKLMQLVLGYIASRAELVVAYNVHHVYGAACTCVNIWMRHCIHTQIDAR